MDVELEKRLTQLEKVVNEDSKLSRIERISFRLGALIIALLTIVIVILTKLVDVVHILKTLRESLPW